MSDGVQMYSQHKELLLIMVFGKLERIKRLVISYGMPWWQQIKSLKSHRILQGNAIGLSVSSLWMVLNDYPKQNASVNVSSDSFREKNDPECHDLQTFFNSTMVKNSLQGEKTHQNWKCNLFFFFFKNTFYLGLLIFIPCHVLTRI